MAFLDGHPDLACSVCLQSFDSQLRKPVSLGGCGHSFCLHCVNSNPSSFTRCPECRARARGAPVINISLLRVVHSLGSGAPAGPDSPVAASREQNGNHVTGDANPGASAAGNAGTSGPDGSTDAHVNSANGHHASTSSGAGASASHSHATGDGAAGEGLWASIQASMQNGRAHTQLPQTATARQRRAPQPPMDGMDARGFPLPSSSGRAAAGGHSWAAGNLAGSLGSPAAVAQAAQALPQALNEARSSFWNWATPVLGLIYLISPLDLLPDFIPLIGWLDDLVVLGAVVYMLWSLANQHAAHRHAQHPHQ